MEATERIRRENEREEAALKLFERYVIAIMNNHNSTDIHEATVLINTREEFRQFIKHGA